MTALALTFLVAETFLGDAYVEVRIWSRRLFRNTDQKLGIVSKRAGVVMFWVCRQYSGWIADFWW